MYTVSRDKDSIFWSLFRMPLEIRDELSQIFFEPQCLSSTRLVPSDTHIFDHTQLWIICFLEHLGNKRPFCQFKIETKLSPEDYWHFFRIFIKELSTTKDECIHYPKIVDTLSEIMKGYQERYLHMCGGSIDVEYLKWSCCPIQDYNQACGKEKNPTFAFECMSDSRRCMLRVSPSLFGAHNDKQNVCLDFTVAMIWDDWYHNI